MNLKCRHSAFASVALAATLSMPAHGQASSYQAIGPATAKAVGVTSDGKWVMGLTGANAFRWSAVTGYETLGAGEAWAATADGAMVVGVATVAGNGEAGLWTAATGLQPLGNYGNDPGCGTFVSNLDEITPDGSVACGMSWQGCGTSALKWTPGGGLELLTKTTPGASARAYCLADDGQSFGGWEEWTNGQRRASLWHPGGTQEFLLATPGDPVGAGELVDINSDATVGCGVKGSSAFLWTASGGVTILPKVAGVGGTYTANGCSEDGSVVVGVAAQFPNLTAWIWTPQAGTRTLLSAAQAAGIPGLTASILRNATGITPDGSRIIGWGNSGAWLVTLPPTWSKLGGGVAGATGTPDLAGTGSMAAGSLVSLSLSGAKPGAQTTLLVGLSALNAPFKGGVLVPNPDLIISGLLTDGAGALLLSSTWPAGLPSGFSTWYQHWISDAAAPKGLAASNGLKGTTP